MKENVPCIEYIYGFCIEGDKECMFKHQGSIDNKPLDLKPNECLPKEYLDKVSNYFDDSQITNINLISSFLIK